MKRLIFSFLFIISICTLFAQSKDELLKMKLKDCTEDHVNKLIDYNLVTQSDIKLMSLCLDNMTKNNVDVENLTLSQFLDSLNQYKKEMNDLTNSTRIFGNDSVCFRGADGEKVYLGKGEMSVEKLVARESKNLPTYFDNQKLNTYFGNNEEVTNIIVELNPDEITLSLFATVIFILIEEGKDLNSYKVGQILEIANRLKNSKELKPFVDFLK